ncbi:MAG TPA: YwqG family protein [Thermoleophilaceae bacterium]|nr:YwqG family protein [Thermoleophilaceae bacterium]
MNGRELIEQAVSGPLAPVADDTRTAVLPSIRLLRAEPGDLVQGNRIGGEPDLPLGVDWPEWQGRPLAFLAQIELGAIPDVQPGRDLLPAGGQLAFFYDAEPERQPWGFDPADRGSGRVIHVPAGAAVERHEAPARLPRENLYEPGDLVPRVELTLPWPDAPAAPDLPLSTELRDAYLDLLEALSSSYGDEDAPRHRLLGHPDQLQGPMQTECQLVSNGLYTGDSSGWEDPRAPELLEAAPEWRLLLQLDSEIAPSEVMWGDDGRVYFWARERDLRAGVFDAGWTVLQCG